MLETQKMMSACTLFPQRMSLSLPSRKFLCSGEVSVGQNQSNCSQNHGTNHSGPKNYFFSLRWLKTVSSTFQDAAFDGSLLPLFIS